jgi:type 1 fimbriae regulatory protein FimB
MVYQAGSQASSPIPVHHYMLRRSGLYYRAALLLQAANLSLHECWLLWNYYATSSAMPASAQIEYQATNRKREETFLLAFDQIKAFSGIGVDENSIDYLLSAYFLFPACKQSHITTGLPLPTGV